MILDRLLDDPLSPLSCCTILEVVEISHACFVHLLGLNPANLKAALEAKLGITAFLFPATPRQRELDVQFGR